MTGPGVEECVLYHFTLAAAPDMLRQFRATLSPDERERADRFLRPEHGDAFTIGRGMLRKVLGEILDTPPDTLEFTLGEQGKPALTRAELEFNVSHSAGHAVIAVTRSHAVGVDIEGPRASSDLDKLARRYFAPEEVDALTTLPDSLRGAAFYRCWSSKEAVMKVTGRGLSLGLNRFVVEVSPKRPPALITPPDDYPDTASYAWFETAVTPDMKAVAVVASPDIRFRACALDVAPA